MGHYPAPSIGRACINQHLAFAPPSEMRALWCDSHSRNRREWGTHYAGVAVYLCQFLSLIPKLRPSSVLGVGVFGCGAKLKPACTHPTAASSSVHPPIHPLYPSFLSLSFHPPTSASPPNIPNHSQMSSTHHQPTPPNPAGSPNASGPSVAPPPLPTGWIAQWDPSSQRYYFVQPSTGTTQWDIPTRSSENTPAPTHAPPAPTSYTPDHNTAPYPTDHNTAPYPTDHNTAPYPTDHNTTTNNPADGTRGGLGSLAGGLANNFLSGGKKPHGGSSGGGGGLGGLASGLLGGGGKNSSGSHGSSGSGGLLGTAAGLAGGLLGGKKPHGGSGGGHGQSSGGAAGGFGGLISGALGSGSAHSSSKPPYGSNTGGGYPPHQQQHQQQPPYGNQGYSGAPPPTNYQGYGGNNTPGASPYPPHSNNTAILPLNINMVARSSSSTEVPHKDTHPPAAPEVPSHSTHPPAVLEVPSRRTPLPAAPSRSILPPAVPVPSRNILQPVVQDRSRRTPLPAAPSRISPHQWSRRSPIPVPPILWSLPRVLSAPTGIPAIPAGLPSNLWPSICRWIPGKAKLWHLLTTAAAATGRRVSGYSTADAVSTTRIWWAAA
ncbi:hypothetical protein K440DRAFT_384009 [Wilcoxina mikolae CBS 423.85]|nr:hypothetical protein K440DRAFT_384009 [Wilcoxina mikolae CBS 423.85]